jgi:uncharacterized damage-inducible protein DinB
MQISASILAMQANYSQWASRRLLTLALTLPEEESRTFLKSFQHIYYADRVWLNRLKGEPQTFEDPPPGPTLADLDLNWLPLLQRFEDFAAQCDPTGILAYKNLKGHPFERPIWQVILHIVNHATYHRGQIAAALRQLGHQPPSTDLIYYYLEQ